MACGFSTSSEPIFFEQILDASKMEEEEQDDERDTPSASSTSSSTSSGRDSGSSSLFVRDLSREDLFLTSKLQPADMVSGDRVRRAVNKSLERLRVDYLDLMLVQWPGVCTLDPSDHQQARYRQVAWTELERCYKCALFAG